MNETAQQKFQRLQALLRQKQRVAVAFSGGVDSSFLLWAAHRTLGGNAAAITVTGDFMPAREQREAAAFAGSLGVRLHVLPADVLALPEFRQNPPERCYFCKRFLFEKILCLANALGMEAAEGSNVDDLEDFRPGRRALQELGVASPLLEAGLTKGDIRQLAHRYGLAVWDKPSGACLASRIPTGDAITREKLAQVEQAEALLHSLGLRQVRVRHHGAVARIETDEAGFAIVAGARQRIAEQLRALGFRYIALDLEPYRTGRLSGCPAGQAGKICQNPVDKAGPIPYNKSK